MWNMFSITPFSTPFSSVSIVDFKQVKISWIIDINSCDTLIKEFKISYADSDVETK